MKTIKALCLLLILFGTSCDSNPEYRDIPNEILNDQDFEEMIELSIILNHEIEYSENPEKVKMHENELKEIFFLLTKRYDSFHENAQKALSDKSIPEFSNFTERLQKGISNREAPPYDGPSVCGNSCGSQGNATNATSCIAGCNYSSAYCIANGGTAAFCSGMAQSCSRNCCDYFCNALN